MEQPGLSNALSSLTTAQTRLLTQLQRLSSGKAINSAADNPAGLAQSASYSVQLSGAAQAARGMEDSIGLLEVAGGAMSQIGEGLQQIQELAVQAGNGALSAGDRRAIQGQIDQIKQGIAGIAGGTRFNGQNLLDGSFSRTLTAGANPGETQPVAIGGLSTSALGIAGLDVTTAAGQTDALAALGQALDRVNVERSNIGAAQAGLQSGLANLAASSENLAAANSRIADADYAQAASAATQAGIQQQASVKALTLYNAVQKSKLDLLP